MTDTQETLEDLLRRFRAAEEGGGPVPRISLASALAAGDDPLHVLPYMAGLGMPVRTLADLLRINADQTEEEIHCFPVAEGVAVSMASDGLWLLFEP
jgi:hypothetical protein